MATSFTLAELAKRANGQVRGDATLRVDGVAALAEAGPHEITWVADDRHAGRLETSRAGAAVVATGFGPTPMPVILTDDPNLAVIEILTAFAPPVGHPPPGVHESAVVSPTARLGEAVAVGANAVIGDDAILGDRTIVHPNVVIGCETRVGAECLFWPGVVIRERCRLGDRVICHPNATIGADGFGYHFTGGRHVKIPQIGTVEIDDDVEIGAGTCIDRAKFGATRIGQGVKIDNHVQIAHNVVIGPHSMIVAQVGLGGSARLGAGVVMAGRAGARDHVVIGDRAQVAAASVALRDVPAGKMVNGTPAIDHRTHLRSQVLVGRLPEYVALIKDLSRRVEQLEATADH